MICHEASLSVLSQLLVKEKATGTEFSSLGVGLVGRWAGTGSKMDAGENPSCCVG